MEAATFLGEIGEIVQYTVHAEVAEASENLVVTVSVPPEMDVSSVPLDDQAEAISASRHGTKEDIVWVVGDVTAGQAVDFHWSAEVTEPGDLMATAVANAKTDAAKASESTDTFLAARADVATTKAEPTKVLGKIIKMVPVTIPAPDGAVLPVTGWSPTGWLWTSIACVGLGSLLLLIGLARSGARRTGALVVALGILTSCTPAQDETVTAPPETQSTPEAADEADEPPADEVKGKRIFNNDPAATTEGLPVPAAEEPAVITIYKRVITDAPADLDLVTQDDRAGDNSLSFTWAEPDREVATATSGVIFTPEQISSLTVGLEWDTDGLNSGVTLENTSSEPLRVQGELILEIAGPGGVGEKLNSGPVDVVLAPGGLVQVSYRYLLPTGEYTLISSFEH